VAPDQQAGQDKTIGANLKDLLADARAQEEAERIMRQMEEGAQRESAEAAASGPKYMPSTEGDDPIVQALMKVVGVQSVESECYVASLG
jgi:hypothetical protein